MIKTKFVICFFLLFCNHCIALNLPDSLSKKIVLSVRAGGYYKLFLGKRYIEPTAYNGSGEFIEHQYDRFTKIPTWGFQTGVMLTYKMKGNWHITSGLEFCNRRIIYKNSTDSVIKYGNSSRIRNIYNVVNYEYNYYNIELSVMISYKYKKIHFSTGVYIPLVTFNNTEYTYVINQFPQDPHWGSAQKCINSIEFKFMIFPSLQVFYDFIVRSFSFSPYFELNFGEKKSIYFRCGVIFPLNYHFNPKPK